MATAQGRGRRRRAPAPHPSRRDRPRVLTRQSAATASVARVPLPPLQDEVGVGPFGDPQCVGQQHLFWVHPHVPRHRGRTHKGAAGRLLHTLARTGAHPRAHARPPARWVRRRKATSPAGGLRRRDHNKAPAGGPGRRRGRGHREQHPLHGAAASREPAAAEAQALGSTARPQPTAAGGGEREEEEVLWLRLGIRLGGVQGCGLREQLRPRGEG